MAGLRLDTKEGAFTLRKTGAPIVPGKSRESLIYQRITSENKARRMPPLASHKTLTPKQIDSIKRWIDSGAAWSEHWSFTPPQRTQPPEVGNNLWARNPIDRFIYAKLAANGLKPAPPASPRALIRRLSLDITGLPPDPAQVEAFVRDASPKAYEKLVDSLLASQHWGEHRGRYWLDAARYGDTHGLHIDNYREIWAYRDWVISAFNRNMPFDQFTVEQLAGDLLPDATLEQQIATGFHRNNVTTNEGGVIPEEVAAFYAKDRVDTTGTVFLGLTLGCASCHDHKFDPILQRDFYSMAAFFRNTVQDPLDANIHDTPPVMVVPKTEDMPRWNQIAQQEKTIRGRMDGIRASSSFEFQSWLKGEDRAKIFAPLEQADELLALDYTAELRVRNRTSTLPMPDGASMSDGPAPNAKALRFDSRAGVELQNFDYFEADRPFSIAAWVYTPKGDDGHTIVSQIDNDSRGRGWTLELGGRIPLFRLTTLPNKSTSIRANTKDRWTPGTWHHLVVTYDGSREPSSLNMIIDGTPIAAERRGEFQRFAGNFRTFAPLRIGSDGRRRFFNGGAVAELRMFTRVISDTEIGLLMNWPQTHQASRKAVDELAPADLELLSNYYLSREYSAYMEAADQLRTLGEERTRIARRGTLTHVQVEVPGQAPSAHILHRGMYDQPRDKVDPAAPSALPPMPASLPKNRLGLAKWLVDPANPLMARVTVNRFWQEIFGTGIVKSSEDFGSQGEAPSHPELLDWLAVDFRESGWDVKRFYRQIFTSNTYRQSVAVTPAKLSKDPANRLLSRGPRFRMDAEMVRDYALAASGLLNPKIGGPSVKPYQPEAIWETVAMKESNTRFYQQDAGPDLYRRSLYTFWKRSAPPSSMEIFNAPSREVCTVRRERTNTPLQALVTMNDPQFVEAARILAAEAIKAVSEGLTERIDFIAARALARPLEPKELELVRDSYRDFLKHYESNLDDAKNVVRVGEAPQAGGVNPAELAALTLVANQILNTDEVLNK